MSIAPPVMTSSHPFNMVRYSSRSDVPNVVPFYAYIHGEVKHRKRTTPEQLKVLEQVFSKETKPSAKLRKDLATSLNMKPRGVQVWFQNRRAKEKTVRNKYKDQLGRSSSAASASPAPAASSRSHTEEPLSPPSTPPETSNSLPGETTFSEEGSSSLPTAAPPSSAVPAPRPKIELLEGKPQRPSIDITSADMSMHSEPAVPRVTKTYTPLLRDAPSAFKGMRRPSLPATLPTMGLVHPGSDAAPRGAPSFPSLSHNDVAALRRGSLDARAMHQHLVSHPYAKKAMERNGVYIGKNRLHNGAMRRTSIPRGPIGLNAMPCPPPHFDTPRTMPNLHHRASMPHVFAGAAVPVNPNNITSHHIAQQLTTTDHGPISQLQHQRRPITRPSLPDIRFHTAPVRTITSPIPGPLPAANFSFGTPSMPEEDNEASSPLAPIPSPSIPRSNYNRDVVLSDSDQDGRIYGYRHSIPNSDYGVESDDATTTSSATSYDASTRFGSLLSNVSAASSATSAYYSDVEAVSEYDCASRRGSFASTEFPDFMAGLNLGAVGNYVPNPPHNDAPAQPVHQESAPLRGSLPHCSDSTTSLLSHSSTSTEKDLVYSAYTTPEERYTYLSAGQSPEMSSSVYSEAHINRAASSASSLHLPLSSVDAYLSPPTARQDTFRHSHSPDAYQPSQYHQGAAEVYTSSIEDHRQHQAPAEYQHPSEAYNSCSPSHYQPTAEQYHPQSYETLVESGYDTMESFHSHGSQAVAHSHNSSMDDPRDLVSSQSQSPPSDDSSLGGIPNAPVQHQYPPMSFDGWHPSQTQTQHVNPDYLS